MTPEPASPEPAKGSPALRKPWKLIVLALLLWAAVAYLLVPRIWRLYFHDHPTLEDAPHLTHTSDGHPGDPLNIGLVGTKEQIIRAMTAAGWFPADPITFESSVRIVIDSTFRRPDEEAPVSALFLFKRKQDLAFELPVGDSPRERHHVRFWKTEKSADGRPLWLGAATFDVRVGFSHTTGQVTHHIGPDVDAERDRIARDLEKASWAEETYWVNGFHRHLEGTNGGGDPWHTDGRLEVVVLKDRPEPAAKP